MTVQTIEMHTFTDEEMRLVIDGLKLANEQYLKLADLMRQQNISWLHQEYEKLAREASDLQLRIEAAL